MNPDVFKLLFLFAFIFGAIIAWPSKTHSDRAKPMDRLILAALVLAGTAVPAFASVTLPEPTTMSVFGLGLGCAYLVKRFGRRK